MTALSSEKRRLLELLLNEKGICARPAEKSDTIPRRHGDRSIPLTLNQEGLWFLDQLDPGMANYNIPGAVRLQGQLDVSALRQSFEEIIRRHDSLRTTFSTDDSGTPHQIVTRSTPLEWTPTDLTGLPPKGREMEVSRLAIDAAQVCFDLERGPLFQVQLLKLQEDEHVLLLTIHHIVADGWSMGILTRELGLLYDAFLRGKPSPLPEVPIQFADYARWEHEQARCGALKSRVDYWKRHLDGCLGVLELPTDHVRPATPSYRGRHQPLKFPTHLTEALKSLSHREDVTLFMTLMSAFKVLLCHLTGQQDMIVGTGFANRQRRELEDLIGYFATVLPLRTKLEENLSFLQLLGRVRSAVLGASSHQGVPLSTLVQQIQPQRDPSRNPLYQVEFTLLTPDRNPVVYGYGLSELDHTMELAGLTMTPLTVEGGISRFDLALFLWDLPGGLAGAVEYSTDLFEAATIAQWMNQFESLLQLVVDQPNNSIQHLQQQLGQQFQRQEKAATKSFKESIRKKLKSIQGSRRRAAIKQGQSTTMEKS